VTEWGAGPRNLEEALAQIVRDKAAADEKFEAERVSVIREKGEREDRERKAVAAAEPALVAESLQRLIEGKKIVADAEATRTAEAVDARLQWIAERADGVLAQAATVSAGLKKFAKVSLPQLAVFERYEADAVQSTQLPASKALAKKFGVLIGLVHELYNSTLRTITTNVAELEKVRARVKTTGGAWGQEEHDLSPWRHVDWGLRTPTPSTRSTR
jgi:type III secretory pathway lipoprotein EscJ